MVGKWVIRTFRPRWQQRAIQIVDYSKNCLIEMMETQPLFPNDLQAEWSFLNKWKFRIVKASPEPASLLGRCFFIHLSKKITECSITITSHVKNPHALRHKHCTLQDTACISSGPENSLSKYSEWELENESGKAKKFCVQRATAVVVSPGPTLSFPERSFYGSAQDGFGRKSLAP